MPLTTYAAAVDLGATSGRVILGAWSKGGLKLTEVHRFSNRFRSLGGHDYWDIGGLWQEAQVGLQRAAAALPRGARLASVGVDAWGVDYALLNDAGRLVFPVHAYRDPRTQPGLQRLGRTRAALERIYAATGIPNVFYNTSLQLEETVASCPAVADLATRCLFLPDYFNYLLSGRMENELTIASTSQLLDVHGIGWSRATLDHFHIPPSWFTPPVLAGTRLGRVRGIPELAGAQVIAVPGHDTACAYDAMPAAPDGSDLFISSGTWSLVGTLIEQPRNGAAAAAENFTNLGAVGDRICFHKNVNGMWLIRQCTDQWALDGTVWKVPELVAASELVPCPEGLLDVDDPDLLLPERMPQRINAQRVKRGLTPLDESPANAPEFASLIFHSLAARYAKVLDRVAFLTGKRLKRLFIVGGANQNTFLNRLTQEATRLEVHRGSPESSTVGNFAVQLATLEGSRDPITGAYAEPVARWAGMFIDALDAAPVPE